jgi:ribosomal protein S18 acetylase RimI-like enzyme
MTNMPIEIRSAVSTDLPRMMGMDHSVASEYVWQLDLRRESGQISASLREVRLPRPISVAYPRNPFSLADEWQYKSAVLVAVDANVMGYVCIMEQSAATVAWITDLAVIPDHRQQGIGSLLLKSAFDWAEERGSHMLIFEMPAKNQSAIRLAQKAGLEFCGYNDHYYANQDVALFFGRMLK